MDTDSATSATDASLSWREADERFHQVMRLGSGGGSDVWLARDGVNGMAVAMKRAAPEGGAPARRALEREGRILEFLRGEHGVVELKDRVRHDDAPCLILEYVDGGALPAEDMRGWSLDARIAVVVEAARAIDRVHRLGVVHGDVKPSNLLLRRTGGIAVIDFGLATSRFVDAPERTGEVAGSPAFVAPEVVEGAAATVASDVYALGVLGFLALDGEYPFRGSDWYGTMMAHIDAPIPALRNASVAQSEAFGPVFASALAKNPALRFETAGALADAVEEACGAVLGDAALIDIFDDDEVLEDTVPVEHAP